MCIAFCSAMVAASSGSVSVGARRPRPVQELLRLGGTAFGHGERAQHAVALGTRREAAISPRCSRRARRVAVLQHPGDGLEQRDAAGRRRPGSVERPRRGSRSPQATPAGPPRGGRRPPGRPRATSSGTVAAATRWRSAAAGSPTSVAAAACRALRRATPRESCTAERTSGCGNATVTGVPGAGSARNPAAVASSSGARGSCQLGQRRHLRERAVHAEHGRGVDEAPGGLGAARPGGRAPPAGRSAARAGDGSPVPHASRRELGEQRPHVQRVALGAVVQAPSGDRGQRCAHLRGEVAQLGLGEPGQRDDRAVLVRRRACADSPGAR